VTPALHMVVLDEAQAIKSATFQGDARGCAGWIRAIGCACPAHRSRTNLGELWSNSPS